MAREKKTRDAKQVLGIILFISLVLSAVFTLIRLIAAPSAAEAGAFNMQRSDYTLMLLQCILGIVVMMLPTFIEHKWSIPIPNFIYVLYYVFLYCGVFLGEVLSFYYRVPHWDTILHLFSGGMLGSLGFILVSLLNDNEHVRVQLSPFFVALFAFCFALAMGAVWEIYEFTVDSLMQLNMQKYMEETGQALLGREALLDTMKDIISDMLSALVVSIIGYFNLKQERKKKQNP
jgi:Predicted membrane protein